jgi:hypothetical protein
LKQREEDVLEYLKESETQERVHGVVADNAGKEGGKAVGRGLGEDDKAAPAAKEEAESGLACPQDGW